MDRKPPASILVAVDYGEASARAIAVAAALARHCGSTLRLLHAETLEAPAYFTSEQVNTLETEWQRTRDQARTFLAGFGRTQTAEPFDVILSDRAPVDAILHEASPADLIVMGTHGRRGPSRWWLGSVAERVLRETRVPLMIIRASASAPSVFDRVVVHAAPPLAGDGAFSYARRLAEEFGSTVIDARGEGVDAAMGHADATLLVSEMPQPPESGWLSGVGEPLVRSSAVPVLFVPE